jgi:hypothetical protein
VAWLKVFLDEETLYRQSVAIEVDGKRWVPVPDSTATAEEFIAALSLLHEIHQQSRWSPWAMQDRAGEYNAALKGLPAVDQRRARVAGKDARGVRGRTGPAGG